MFKIVEMEFGKLGNYKYTFIVNVDFEMLSYLLCSMSTGDETIYSY